MALRDSSWPSCQAPVPRSALVAEVFGKEVSQAIASPWRTSERRPAFVTMRRPALISSYRKLRPTPDISVSSAIEYASFRPCSDISINSITSAWTSMDWRCPDRLVNYKPIILEGVLFFTNPFRKSIKLSNTPVGGDQRCRQPGSYSWRVLSTGNGSSLSAHEIGPKSILQTAMIQAGSNHRSAAPSYGSRVMSQWRMNEA